MAALEEQDLPQVCSLVHISFFALISLRFLLFCVCVHQAKADELFVAAHKEAEATDGAAAEAEAAPAVTYKASRRSSLKVG
jgi:hypothetical protein